MRPQILAVGYDRQQFKETQKEWMKYGIVSHGEADISGAIIELLNHNEYLLVIIFSDNAEYLASLEIIKGLVKAPILIIKPEYDGTEKILAIDAGADEYIPWPETVRESVASGRALIRHHQESEQTDGSLFTIFNCGDLLLCVEQRKVFVCGKETSFTRHEFDFLFLLLKGMGRVYTHEQICGHIWGEESAIRGNALWNLVSRLRAKIIGKGGDDRILQTVRDVGYRIAMINSV